MTGIFTKRKKFEGTDTHRGERGRDWNDGSVNQEMPRIGSDHQKPEETRKDPLLEASDRAWPS